MPADAKAAVISPSIVGDRFIQLTPAYSGGERARQQRQAGGGPHRDPAGARRDLRRLNDLNIALGPDGANKPVENGVGPLTRLLDSTARNFGGQGAEFNKTLKNLGALTKTLADNKDELFGTLAQVEDFTKTLADNDGTVRQFNDSLAGGADLLAGERQELAAVLRNLSVAMVQVRGFVKENRGSLTRNIAGLNRISKILVKRRDQLDKTLRYAPAALNNLFLAGNVKQGTLDTRDNVGQLENALRGDPATALCTLIGGDRVRGLRASHRPGPRPHGPRRSRGDTAAEAAGPGADRQVPRWSRGGDPMTSSPRSTLAAPPYVGVAGRLGLRCARALRLLGLRRPAARRRQDRGQPDDDQGDVPRRPRPRPAVDGQGQRRHRRQGDGGRPQGLRRRGHRRGARGRQAPGQRPRGDPADQPPR